MLHRHADSSRAPGAPAAGCCSAGSVWPIRPARASCAAATRRARCEPPRSTLGRRAGHARGAYRPDRRSPRDRRASRAARPRRRDASAARATSCVAASFSASAGSSPTTGRPARGAEQVGRPLLQRGDPARLASGRPRTNRSGSAPIPASSNSLVSWRSFANHASSSTCAGSGSSSWTSSMAKPPGAIRMDDEPRSDVQRPLRQRRRARPPLLYDRRQPLGERLFIGRRDGLVIDDVPLVSELGCHRPGDLRRVPWTGQHRRDRTRARVLHVSRRWASRTLRPPLVGRPKGGRFTTSGRRCVRGEGQVHCAIIRVRIVRAGGAVAPVDLRRARAARRSMA